MLCLTWAHRFFQTRPCGISSRELDLPGIHELGRPCCAAGSAFSMCCRCLTNLHLHFNWLNHLLVLSSPIHFSPACSQPVPFKHSVINRISGLAASMNFIPNAIM